MDIKEIKVNMQNIGSVLSPNRYVTHVSFENKRELIIKNGIVRQKGNNHNNLNAIFAVNSIYPKYGWYYLDDLTFYNKVERCSNWCLEAQLCCEASHLDFWRIDTWSIPNMWNKDFCDAEFYSDTIMTIDYDIPIAALALYKTWCGKSEYDIIKTKNTYHIMKNFGMKRCRV